MLLGEIEDGGTFCRRQTILCFHTIDKRGTLLIIIAIPRPPREFFLARESGDRTPVGCGTRSRGTISWRDYVSYLKA